MSPSKYVILNFLLISMTVPWVFTSSNIKSVGGFPIWAFYTLLTTFIYAIIIAYLLHKYWMRFSSIDSKNK